MPEITPLSAEIINHTPDLLETLEAAGRTCYKSEDKCSPDSAGAFVRMLIKRGHVAVLEHGSITAHIVCDRGVSHELVRHRLAAYCQESTRYCNYGTDRFGGKIKVVEPPMETEAAFSAIHAELTEEDKQVLFAKVRSIWYTAMEAAEDAYIQMTHLGVKAQIARSVLPICTKTEVVITANPREWRHIFKMRTDRAAHPMIRKVMLDLFYDFKTKWGPLYEDLEN